MTFPKAQIYEVEFIEAGLVGYPEMNTTLLVKEEALSRMAKTMLGQPCLFTHEGNKVLGYVTKVWRCDISDKWKLLVSIDDERANELLEKGWGFSCQYVVSETLQGGSLNQVPYDEEIVNGYYEHIAVVENPRYDQIQFRRMNSFKKNNKSGEKTMHIPFMKKKMPSKIKNESSSQEEKDITFENNMDKHIMFENGESISLEELVNVYKNRKANETPEVYTEDTLVIDDQEVPIKDLLEAFEDHLEDQVENSEEDETSVEEIKEEEKTNSLMNSSPRVYQRRRSNAVPLKPSPKVPNSSTNESFHNIRRAVNSAQTLDKAKALGICNLTQDKVNRGNAKYGRRD